MGEALFLSSSKSTVLLPLFFTETEKKVLYVFSSACILGKL